MKEYEVQMIKRQWDAGVPIKQIARQMPYKMQTSLRYIWRLQREGVIERRVRKRGADLIASAYHSGITNPYELADMYGYKIGTIYAYLRDAGIRRNRPAKNWKKVEKSKKTKEIIACLKSGVGVCETARRFGVTKQWVSLVKKREERENE